jgi:large subunit ribosomal protein L6
MSRLGKLPIVLPNGVSAQVAASVIVVKGPKGELTQRLMDCVTATVKDQVITVSVNNPTDKKERAAWGLFRSLIKNMVIGVSSGFSRQLEVNGVGYKVAGGGTKLNFNLGHSHPIEFALPVGVTAAVDGKLITLSGADKQLVGEMAARIRRLRKPEPYKGKGIKYVEEVIRRKAGKTAASK